MTKVVFTHAHADHLWGVIDPLGGGSSFEKATCDDRGRAHYWPWYDESRVAEPFRAMAGTHRRLKSIADRIQTIAAGTEIVPGLAYVDTAGHTPGHVSVLLKSGSEQLLIGGDALVNAVSRPSRRGAGAPTWIPIVPSPRERACSIGSRPKRSR